jgi:cytochrome c556
MTHVTGRKFKMSGMRLRIWSAIAVALVVTFSAAAMTATDTIKERQKTMGGVRDGLMALAAIAKKEQPFDAEVVQTNAVKIADHLAKAAALFPAGSSEGDVQTWAKPEIWTDREHFDEIMESTRQAAVDVQSVTDPAAFPPALGKLGTGCKSCHDMYRLPKH